MTLSLHIFSWMFMDGELMNNVDVLKCMTEFIQTDVKWELQLLEPPASEHDTYQKERDDLLVDFRFSLEELISLLFSKHQGESKESKSPLLHKLDRVVELSHWAPNLFKGREEWVKHEKGSAQETREFVATMMEYGAEQNVQDVCAMSNRSYERSKEGLEFFKLKIGKFNVMWLLLAILFSQDQPEMQKIKIRRVFELESAGLEWECDSRGGCVVL
jgi:hypothetical protein